MLKNICKNKECKLYDTDFGNNCRIMREITRCRILYPLPPVSPNRRKEKKR